MPLIATIESPTCRPAASAGEPGSTRVTTAGSLPRELDAKAVHLAARRLIGVRRAESLQVGRLALLRTAS